MRASARERAHTGTLTSRSVEKVKTTSLCGRVPPRLSAWAARRQKILASPRGRLEIADEAGVPSGRAGAARYRTAENKPTEPGRACPVEGVRH